jgi:hypothetical protein
MRTRGITAGGASHATVLSRCYSSSSGSSPLFTSPTSLHPPSLSTSTNTLTHILLPLLIAPLLSSPPPYLTPLLTFKPGGTHNPYSSHPSPITSSPPSSFSSLHLTLNTPSALTTSTTAASTTTPLIIDTGPSPPPLHLNGSLHSTQATVSSATTRHRRHAPLLPSLLTVTSCVNLPSHPSLPSTVTSVNTLITTPSNTHPALSITPPFLHPLTPNA